MNKNIMRPGQTLLDPKDEKYYLCHGRWRITRKINDKLWEKAHLVYAFSKFLTLETMKILLDLNYVVHHINGNPIDDSATNLELIKKAAHTALHNTGNKYCAGRFFSIKTRRKISAAKKGKTFSIEVRHNMSKARTGNKNSRWIQDFPIEEAIRLKEMGLSYASINKKLNYTPSTIYRRLKKSMEGN